MVTALSLVGKAGASLAFAVSFLITSEIFPTHNRQVAMGIASVASRLAGMAAPYAGEPLVSMVTSWYWNAFRITGIWNGNPQVSLGPFSISYSE